MMHNEILNDKRIHFVARLHMLDLLLKFIYLATIISPISPGPALVELHFLDSSSKWGIHYELRLLYPVHWSHFKFLMENFGMPTQSQIAGC